MISPILAVIASLSVFTAPCNALCEKSFDDVLIMDCTYSELTYVPASEISNDVQSLDLSNNQLTKLKRSDWKNYSSLKTLYLSGNEIESIESDAFFDLKQLRNLDLSNNKLRYICPEIFSGNSALLLVSLRRNPLSDLPLNSPFFGSNSLISLELSSCQLTSLSPQTLSKLPSLRYLDLSYNDMITIDLNTFKCLNELDSLDLRNNKWNCDCEIVDVLNWVSERRRALGLHIAHSPVKCLDKGKYRILWSAASLGKQCKMEPIGAETVKSLIPVDRRNTTETPAVVTEINKNTEEIGNDKSQWYIFETTTKSPIRKSNISNQRNLLFEREEILIADETSRSNIVQRASSTGNLFKTNINIILVFCVLLIMLTISLVALVAVNRYTNYLKSRSDPDNVRSQVRTCTFSHVPLMPSSIRSDLKFSDYRNSTDSFYHVYEQIK